MGPMLYPIFVVANDLPPGNVCIHCLQVGNFPQNFVEDIKIPHLAANQHLYAAVKSFDADEPGDLGFKRGSYAQRWSYS